MALSSLDLINGIIEREGTEYTNYPNDRGGPTKFGITLATLSSYRGHPCCAEDVAALTSAQAFQIYNVLYIVKPHFSQIANGSLEALVVDWGVNSGTATPAKHLQQAVGVKTDGVLGSRSLQAINGADQAQLFNTILSARVAFYKAIVARNPSQGEFLNGWLNRCNQFTFQA